MDINADKERITLGIKQLTANTSSKSTTLKKGSIVNGKVAAVSDDELTLDLGNNVVGKIKKTDLSREKSEQNTSSFKVGDSLEASVIAIEKSGEVKLSVRALEVAQEKQAVKDYGNADSGAVLGDILGMAIAESKEKPAKAEPKKTATAKKEPAKKTTATKTKKS